MISKQERLLNNVTQKSFLREIMVNGSEILNEIDTASIV